MKKVALIVILLISMLNNKILAQELSHKEKKAKELHQKMFNDAMKIRLNAEQENAKTARETYNFTSWVLHPVSELIQNWGAYTRAVDDLQGGKIIVYENTSSGSGGTYTPGYVVTNGLGQVVESRATEDHTYSYNDTYFTEIHVNSQGIIVQLIKGKR